MECVAPKNFKVDMKKDATNGLGVLQILRQYLEGKGGVKNSAKSADIVKVVKMLTLGGRDQNPLKIC